MGVAGSGKTTVGLRLAAALRYEYYDGDDFHSPASVAKMRSGEPLGDEDRLPWLARLRDLMERSLASDKGIVIGCSALRAAYRDALLPREPALRDRFLFVYLRVTPETARQRVGLREGHYMPASLVDSQFAALEEPTWGEPASAIVVDAGRVVEEVVAEALRFIAMREQPPAGGRG